MNIIGLCQFTFKYAEPLFKIWVKMILNTKKTFVKKYLAKVDTSTPKTSPFRGNYKLSSLQKGLLQKGLLHLGLPPSRPRSNEASYKKASF